MDQGVYDREWQMGWKAMNKLLSWLSRDPRLDEIIAEQERVLKEGKELTKKTSKLHRDTQRSIDSTLRTVNNTWGQR